MNRAGTQQKPRTAALWFWLAALMAALAVFLYVAIFVYGPAVNPVAAGEGQGLIAAADADPDDTTGDDPAGLAVDAGERWALWISALSLAVTTVGFFSSALLGWRQEVREAQLQRVEVEHLRIEMKKMLLEIRQLQQELGSQGRSLPGELPAARVEEVRS